MYFPVVVISCLIWSNAQEKNINVMYKWMYHSETSLKHTQMFWSCHTVVYNVSGWSHDLRVTWQELETNGGDLVALVSVEVRGSLVNVEGFLNLCYHYLGVIHSKAMTSGKSVFCDSRVEMFSICVFLEPSAQHSRCLTNVFLVTFTTRNAVYHPTLFFRPSPCPWGLPIGTSRC